MGAFYYIAPRLVNDEKAIENKSFARIKKQVKQLHLLFCYYDRLSAVLVALMTDAIRTAD